MASKGYILKNHTGNAVRVAATWMTFWEMCPRAVAKLIVWPSLRVSDSSPSSEDFGQAIACPSPARPITSKLNRMVSLATWWTVSLDLRVPTHDANIAWLRFNVSLHTTRLFSSENAGFVSLRWYLHVAPSVETTFSPYMLTRRYIFTALGKSLPRARIWEMTSASAVFKMSPPGATVRKVSVPKASIQQVSSMHHGK